MKKWPSSTCFFPFSLACRRNGVEKRLFFIPYAFLISVTCFSATQSNTVTALPASSDPAYLIAKASLDRQDWGNAILQLKGLFDRNSSDPTLAVGLSRALISDKKRDEALAVLSRAIREAKASEKPRLIQRFLTASRLFMTNKTFETYQDGINLMMSKKYRSARERFERALLDEPQNTAILSKIAQCYVLDSDFETATQKLTEARKSNPLDPDLRLWLGRAYQLQGMRKDALMELRGAKENLPDSELATVWFSEELVLQSQVATAMRLLVEDTEIWPFHLWSLTSLAKLRLQAAHLDSRGLWTAQKELQLVMSRIDSKAYLSLLQRENDFGISLLKSSSEIKAEVQKLMQQVEELKHERRRFFEG